MQKFISSLAAIALVITSVVISPALAAGMAITDTLSSTTAGATTVGHSVTFTTTQNLLAGDTIKITFDSGFTALSATASADYIGNGGVLDTAAVVGNVVTITLGDAKTAGAITIGAGITATNPVAGNYTISVITSKGDFGAVVVPVGNANQVSVTATVDPILTFALGSNTIALGTLSSTAATSASHTMTAASNATSGYVVTVSGATLTSGANDIDAYGAAGAASVPGTEGFGINLKANTTPVVGAEKVGGTGVAVGNFATVNTFAFDATGPNTIANSATAPSGSSVFTVSYVANIAAGTAAGSYGTTLTYTITPTF